MKRSGIFRFFAGVCLVWLVWLGVLPCTANWDENMQKIAKEGRFDILSECREEIRSRHCIQTFQITPQLVLKIEIYPIRPKTGEPVYTAAYLENVSEETVKGVGNFWLGVLQPYGRNACFLKNIRKDPQKHLMDLKPGERSLVWFYFLHASEDDFLPTPTKTNQRICRWTPFHWEYNMPFFLNGEEKEVGYVREDHWNRYTASPEAVEEKIKKWYGFYRPANIFDEADVLLKKVPSSRNRIPQKENLWDLYLGDTAVLTANAEELPDGFVLRDEIRLSKMLSDFLHEENEQTAEIQKDAILRFLEQRPFPQKIIMSFRLFRLDETFFRDFDAWENWYAAEPPELSRSQRERLLELNEEFRKMRENALLAETKEVRP